MSTTILIVVLVFGLIMPLFWIIGAMTSVGYFFVFMGKDMIVRHRGKRANAGPAHKERAVISNPQLGFTMADGGDAIEPKGEDKKT